MKYIIIICFQLLFSSIFAQTDSLFNYVKKVDEIVFDDSTFLTRELKGINHEIKGFSYKGYFFKAVIKYVELDRIRTVYFSGKNSSNSSPKVCYAIEYDMLAYDKKLEVGYWNDSLLIDNTKNSLFELEKGKPKWVRWCSDVYTDLEFKKVDDFAEKFTVRGLAKKIPELPPYCGDTWQIMTVKFKIDRTDKKVNKRHIKVIISCPRSYGESYFRKGEKYDMVIATNSGVFLPVDEKDKKLLWVREIERVDKKKLQ